MEIVKLTKEKYKEWDKFCLESDDAWFWHTTDWMEYILNLKHESNSQNFSFLVYKEDKVISIVPLICEINNINEKNIKEFLFGGWAVPSLALNNNITLAERDDIYKFIFNEVDRLAIQNNIVRARFTLDPLSYNYLYNGITYNYLMNYGYLDISLNAQLIDLKKSKNELWNELRRNHKRNIKKGKNFKIIIYTAKNITQNIFNNYKEMHHLASGRKTRSDITFKLMYNWLKSGSAFLAAVKYKGKFIGFEYYSIYKNNVYGFSAANNPEYINLPVRHFLEWETILWMKKQRYRYYEIGLLWWGNMLYGLPDKKKIDISHFKKGFGGIIAPLFMGEKYYNKDYYLEVNTKRIKRYANFLNNIQ